MIEAAAEKTTGIGKRWLPNSLLATASIVLAAAAIVAVLRGRAHWGEVPPLIWLHLASILVATLLTPVMLLRRKGNRRHRQLGYLWVGGMVLTGMTSLLFNARSDGRANLGVFSGDVSPIHILSVWVLIQVPVLVMRARRHDVAGHEGSVRGMVLGALLIAGFFTFPFGRMLGEWLLG